MLCLLVLFRIDEGELGKAGGDRDTSSGLAPCMRAWTITRVGQRRVGLWPVLALESVLLVKDCMRNWIVGRVRHRCTGTW